MSDRLVLWDFDGTLASRPGMWSGCVMETLDEHEPGHGIALDAIGAGLYDGFPWHVAHEPHPHLCEDGAWWDEIGGLIARALERAGVEPARARRLAPAVRERYVDHTIGWELFDDVLPALAALSERGWRHAILSNHVPELEDLVVGLGLDGRFEAVFSSARTGYEKPHAEAFRLALRACGEPAHTWMVGDNPVADVQGAEAVGLPAILVRTAGPAGLRATGVREAAELVLTA